MPRRLVVILLSIAVALGAAVSAHAGGFLETIDLTNAIASPIPGQLLAAVIGIKWDVRTIPVQYRVNAAGGEIVPNPVSPLEPVLTLADATATMQQAFDEWNAVPSSFIEMNIAGTVENHGLAGFDFVNELTFFTGGDFSGIAASPSVALIADSTFADGDDIDEDGDSDVSAAISTAQDVDGDGDLEFPAGFYKAGTILDNDVQFNTKAFAPPGLLGFRFTIGDAALDTDPQSVDLLAVAVHEFGHSHGLSHSVENQTSASDGDGATMFPFIDTTDPEAERQARSLHTDDIAWSSYLYPEGTASSGPARLRKGDVAFDRAFGLISGDVRHGVLNQPLAGASVHAVDANGHLYASGLSGTTRVSVDPVSGLTFVPPAASDAIVNGHYVIPVAPGAYAVGVEAVDGQPVSAASISITAQIGAFFGQQDFHEEFYNRARERDTEDRPGRSATVRVHRGATTSGIDIVTNRTTAMTDFLESGTGFTDAPPGTYYAFAVPASVIADLDAAGVLIPHSIVFNTASAEASVSPVFAEAMLTTGTIGPDGTAALDLITPLDRISPFVGEDNDYTPFFLKTPHALGRRIHRGIERGEIENLFLVLRVPTNSPFPGTRAVPPLVGIDTISDERRSFVSTDDGATFTLLPQGNFMFSLVFAAPAEDGSPAPVAENSAITTVEDTPVAGTLVARDPDAAPLRFGLSSVPRHGVVLLNPFSGAFTYSPDPDFAGDDVFLFRVTNDRYPSNAGIVTVSVTPINDAPVASDRRVETAVDTPVTGTVVATDAEGDALVFSIVSDPMHGVAAITGANTGEFIYTPNPGFVGLDRLTFRASDGMADSNVGTLTILVGTPQEFAPLDSVVITTQAGVAVNGTLESASPGGSVTFSIERAPELGVLDLTDPATGAFTYVPNPGAVGFDTFTFAADAGAGPLTGKGLVFIVAATPEWPGGIERVSVSNNGVGGDGFGATVSADGRFVAFESTESNLVPGDTNATYDVFVRDRATGETTRVSIADDGTESNNLSVDVGISSDGRYVAFSSTATNLVPDDTNASSDIFVHDRLTGATTRVSVASDGSQGNSSSSVPSISADGRYVAFLSFASNLVPDDTSGPDIFLHDRATGETTQVNVATDGTRANAFSSLPILSADGRYIAFFSSASNLVADDTNGVQDAFVHDRVTGETVRVSRGTNGTEGNGDSGPRSLSPDGRFVVFTSTASNLVEGDTNGETDVFLHDRVTGETTRVNVTSDGVQALGGPSFNGAVSADGRYVAFESNASNILANDANGGFGDVFVHDRATGETRLVSVPDTGEQPVTSGASLWTISPDGRYVVFTAAGDLIPGGSQRETHVYVVGGVAP
jgi:Tol biopolymer transport system component